MIAVVLAAVAQGACGGAPAPDDVASDSSADTPAPVDAADPSGEDPSDPVGYDPDSVSDPWEAAWLRGVVFRAVGQEPGWLLELDEENRLRFLADYGQISFRPPAPAAVAIDTATHAVTWSARTDAHDLVATVREAPCTDTMSGEAFTHVVVVRFDGRELDGCGRRAGTGTDNGFNR